MLQIVEVRPLPGYRLFLRYEDGVEGEVDLSHLVGHGVFVRWNDPTEFQRVTVCEGRYLAWGDEIDLCADALYLEITGKSPEDLFPNLKVLECLRSAGSTESSSA
ncbi:MAG: DUF2442 domain-containing protein [Planctomycetes bacterium]|nr:DUF2442 domain-containing protein [Planctomycetota bacterium]